MRTCQNPSGDCLQDLRGLEGRWKAELAESVGLLGSELGSILGSSDGTLGWEEFFLIP